MPWPEAAFPNGLEATPAVGPRCRFGPTIRPRGSRGALRPGYYRRSMRGAASPYVRLRCALGRRARVCCATESASTHHPLDRRRFEPCRGERRRAAQDRFAKRPSSPAPVGRTRRMVDRTHRSNIRSGNARSDRASGRTGHPDRMIPRDAHEPLSRSGNDTASGSAGSAASGARGPGDSNPRPGGTGPNGLVHSKARDKPGGTRRAGTRSAAGGTTDQSRTPRVCRTSRSLR